MNGNAPPREKPVSKKELLSELLGLGGILGELRSSDNRLSFASQLMTSFVRIMMNKYGIPTREDATDIDVFLHEIELGGEKILTLKADLYSMGVSLEKLRDTVLDTRRLLGARPVRLEFGEDVWRNLTYLYGNLLRLLLPGEPSEVSTVMQMISGGESQTVEFKSSIRWDMREEKISRDLRKAVAKEVAAFMNSEGGTLLIGVDDDGEIVGLEKDIDTLPGRKPDGLQRVFHETVSNLCGKECYEYIGRTSFVEIYDKTILVVTISRSHKPIYFIDGDNVQLYVRIGNTTRAMNVREAIEYYDLHWKSSLETSQ